VTHSWQASARQYFVDFKRVFRASKGVAVFLFLSGAYIGLFPVLEFVILGGWLDALIGARGIGVWTSDVGKYLWYEIILLLLCVPSIVFSRQLDGLVKRLNRSTQELFLIVGAGLVALPAAPIIVGLIILFMIGFSFIKHQRIRWAMSTVMICFALQPLWLLADRVVERAILPGNLISWGGALVIFIGYTALRPYLHFHPKHESDNRFSRPL